MIPVSAAKQHIQEQLRRGAVEWIPLEESLDRVLAQSLSSAVQVPHFDNSAMDGYAFHFDSWQGQALQIVGEVAAGHAAAEVCAPGTAVRIFTGAKVPAGADTVVMQEKTRVEAGMLHIEDTLLKRGGNVRLAGSQTRAGQKVADAHTQLTAPMIGFLASLGIAKVPVFGQPKVSIIVTGNEIVAPGEALKEGQVYECNSFSLRAAFQKMGVYPTVQRCEDNPQAIASSIAAALDSSDLLILTGGVSVGDYDFVIPALQQLQVQQVFHKVKQKPAKPLYFGVHNQTIVFGLPGNPASVLTSYYVYVAPWLRHYQGGEAWPIHTAQFVGFHASKPGLTRFLKGNWDGQKVQLTEGQESYRMDGFAVSNCIVELPEECAAVSDGDSVTIIPF